MADKRFLEGKIVIIAEDEDTNSFYLYEVIKETGATIIQATNGKEVVDYIFSGKKADLILMDIKMPVMNGFDAVKEIHKKTKDIPIIAQTAYAMYDERKKAMDSGFTDYITKPIDPDLLIESIRKVFRIR